METLLEHLSRPAWVATARGRIVHANAPGQQWLVERSPHGRTEIEDTVRNGHHPLLEVTPLMGMDSPPYVLITACTPAPGSWIVRAAARWDLSPRQLEVLRRLLEGDSNKEIALAMGITVGTVEFHLHALLSKAQCQSRSQLVAMVMRDAMR